MMFSPCLSGPLIPPAINAGVGVDVGTTGLGAGVCKMGIEIGFIILGVSDLVGDLRDMSLARVLGVEYYGINRRVD